VFNQQDHGGTGLRWRFTLEGIMARHHVISTTGCDVFFKLVTHYKEKFGARFDDMTVTFSANGNPVLGATQKAAAKCIGERYD
jgi:hypothetical protein